MERDAARPLEGGPSAAEQGGERIAWEFHQVTLTRVPGYGFGIAVSGGRDNPHFANGDPAIAISDVLKAGPAEGKLQVNDRIISANGVSLENVEYATAVQVLRDSGSTVSLAVRRRVVLPGCPPPPPPPPHGAAHAQTLKLCLTKASKKDDLGLVLGCKIYVRELARANRAGAGGAEAQLQEGDVLLRINNHSTDGMTLKEARKLIDASKDKLSLVVRREPRAAAAPAAPAACFDHAALTKESHSSGNYLDGLSGPNYSSQNLYVQPPTRHHHHHQQQPPPAPPHQPGSVEDKSNLLPRGRSRGPLLDVSLSQLDRPATPVGASTGAGVAGVEGGGSHGRSRSGLDEPPPPQPPLPHDLLGPPRPPPPRPEDYYSSRRQLYDDDPLLQRSKQPIPDPRFITFQKEGSVGIRLTGGNEVGIFVTAVQPGSPASLQGLQPGDKILKVNDMDMKGITREEAVLFLLSLQDQIDLIVQYRKDEYEQIVASQRGDSFHIKAHFNYDQPNKGEMSFRKGDVFHVVDTLHNGVVGSWQVFRIGRNNQEVQKGIIPNKARAEELATAQFNATKKELTASESRGSFFRRRRGSHRRSKSLGRDHWDDVVFADSISKFPAYERVVLRHPGFVRPVVLFGPVADIAREKLLKDFPDKFTSPQLDSNLEEIPKSQKSSGIIRLSAIREIMDRGKHALLDITPNAVDRLNYAQFYPIVVFLRAESKHVVKELRAGLSKAAHKSSKKLFEQCQKLEKVWGHTFTCSVTLTSPDSWYRKVRELIEKQQNSPVWMSESKPDEALSDDFLFPMTSRLSYASSPESDLDLSPEPHGSGVVTASPPPRLIKSSSDPSIATQEDTGPGYSAPPPYSANNPYKQSSYDSVSSYDSYSNRLGPNAHDDLKCSTNGGPLSPRNHDPYRFTRSTAQPIKVSNTEPKPNKPPDYSKYRPSDYNKPMPPPKSANYKPVPPPKPKNYRPPPTDNQNHWTRTAGDGNYDQHSAHKSGEAGLSSSPVGILRNDDNANIPPVVKSGTASSSTYQHSKSYSTAGSLDGATFTPHQNGAEETNGGFDSGHGSSLDRNYNPSVPRTAAGAGGGQYYYNVPPSRNAPPDSVRNHNHHGHHNREPSGLDLANREQRGSAFELYKKPTDPRGNTVQHYLDNNLRGEGGGEVVATARGVFSHEGGTLHSPETGVAIVIPPGALPCGANQEIYFKVCRDNSVLPPLDVDKGEALLSPLVMCGPHGLKFQVPVELRLPHWASSDPSDPWSFALKSGESGEHSCQPKDWQSVALDSNNTAKHIGPNSVSVLVDHF
ncbi:tight junction protein ZO-1 isoform X4 [Schistocerca cancellata]|uniref:tight junction protein ZO-1 isoform X4 n=1 Tax=Schistocerca cancellata TaxID=274614 RepID=UPI002118AFDC|nr:tight junction protein ZO-1 isoform X4 [Schistocerca cancellata]